MKALAELIGAVVAAILSSPDPTAAARRAQEAARRKGVDELLKKAKPKR